MTTSTGQALNLLNFDFFLELRLLARSGSKVVVHLGRDLLEDILETALTFGKARKKKTSIMNGHQFRYLCNRHQGRSPDVLSRIPLFSLLLLGLDFSRRGRGGVLAEVEQIIGKVCHHCWFVFKMCPLKFPDTYTLETEAFLVFKLTKRLSVHQLGTLATTFEARGLEIAEL